MIVRTVCDDMLTVEVLLDLMWHLLHSREGGVNGVFFTLFFFL